jgi:hypothetical protein
MREGLTLTPEEGYPREIAPRRKWRGAIRRIRTWHVIEGLLVFVIKMIRELRSDGWHETFGLCRGPTGHLGVLERGYWQTPSLVLLALYDNVTQTGTACPTHPPPPPHRHRHSDQCLKRITGVTWVSKSLASSAINQRSHTI